MSNGLRDKINELSHDPGVYIFRDIKNKVIYVGKAKSLKSRVSSYFQKNLSLEPKTRVMVSKIVDLDTIKTASELEALILEAELIKKHKPKYNIIHKDDKSHLYIVFRKDTVKVKGKKRMLVKVITARKTDLKKNDVKFGPFTNSTTTRQILRSMRKIFPFRDCSASKFRRYQKLDRPCLYGHLGLCLAPCLEETDLRAVRKQITRLKRFLGGKSDKIISEYERSMKKASKEKNYEEAAKYRDMLKKFIYIRTNFRTADKYIENPNLVEDLAEKALKNLESSIPILNKKPKRIECFDISDISGKEAVGSMVVSLDGKIDKSQYRRFKIKLKSKPDDVFMLQEVLTRRLKRDWDKPDLLVLDGGKGQVSGGLEVLENEGFNIPLVGLAKKKETIIYKKGNEFKKINLSENDEGLKLLMRLRDEAHRFAQSYHHHLRLKKIKV